MEREPLTRPWRLHIITASSVLLLAGLCEAFAPERYCGPTGPFVPTQRHTRSCRMTLDDDDLSELSQRIADLSDSESTASRAFEEGLQRRVQNLAASEAALQSALDTGRTALPAVVFDALLPRQRLAGSTTDETFGRLLYELGLGGIFAMVSLNARARKVRRHGVICRIERVDAGSLGHSGRSPTAVDFSLVGMKRCRLLGPSEGMMARVGRWRRGYDPNGEEVMLGFGEESFQASPFGIAEGNDKRKIENNGSKISVYDWTSVEIDCGVEEEDDEEVTPEHIAKAENIIRLIEKWKSLASDAKTYDNVDVVASARIQKGHPGLFVDPYKLLGGVLDELGPMPAPNEPTALAFWGAALVNPLPPMGIALEIRGKMLEAKSIDERLIHLERTVTRSIANLNGTNPL